jgi:hypothetical protein
VNKLDAIDEAISSFVEAKSQIDKEEKISIVSVRFYHRCRKLGMKREEVLSLAGAIIDRFTEDIRFLDNKISKKTKED